MISSDYQFKKDFIFPNLFSKNNKMPDLTFPLPAGEIHKGGSCLAANYKASENVVAICDECYAQKGRAIFSNVRRSRQRRFEYVRSNPFFPMEAACQLKWFIGKSAKKGSNFLPIRVHDSGDFFSVRYIQDWQMIVRMTAFICQNYFQKMLVSFWFPTRMWIADNFLKELVSLQKLNNEKCVSVAVRPSAIHIGDACPEISGLASGTSVEDGIGNCPAIANALKNRKNGEKLEKHSTNCAEVKCFKCWNSKIEVVYGKH